MITVQLLQPVVGIAIHDGSMEPDKPESDPAETSAEPRVPPELLAELEQNRAMLAEKLAIVDDLVEKLSRFQNEVLSTHRKEVAGLSVEIARKVLMQKVKDSDYEIEKIIEEALKNAPVQQDLTVHLHPDDLRTCQALQAEGGESHLKELVLVADPGVGKAECLVETPKGVVKSFVENHLDKIREALERVN